MTSNPKIKELREAIVSKTQFLYVSKGFEGVEVRLGIKAFDEMNIIGFRHLFIPLQIPEDGVERAIRRLEDKNIDFFKIEMNTFRGHDGKWMMTFIKDKKLKPYEVWMEPIIA